MQEYADKKQTRNSGTDPNTYGNLAWDKSHISSQRGNVNNSINNIWDLCLLGGK